SRRQIRHPRIDRVARLRVDSGRTPGGRARAAAVADRLQPLLLLEVAPRVPALAAGGVPRGRLLGLGLTDAHVGDDLLFLLALPFEPEHGAPPSTRPRNTEHRRVLLFDHAPVTEVHVNAAGQTRIEAAH